MRRIGPAAALLPALPVLFLHIDYQPKLGVGIATLKLQDAAVLLLAAGAIWSVRRDGWGPWTRAPWLAAGALLAWIVAACFYPLAQAGGFAWKTHLVTAVEFLLYAGIGIALPLLLRRREDVSLLFATIAGWSAVASLVGLMQFFGVRIFEAWPAGWRQPSFLGHHDLAALSGAALTLGLAALVVDLPRFPSRLGLVAGTVGLILSGASAGIVGVVLAVVALLAVTRPPLRRAGAIVGVTALVTIGVFLLRARDFDQFIRFLGIKQEQTSTRSDVQTYSQRTLLAYIGGRIFIDHPIVGVGWQGSAEYDRFRPYLADAHRKFPDAAAQAFPDRQNRYGVQNFYVQTLADLGLVGALLLAAFFAVALVASLRAALRGSGIALVALLWLLLVLGVWNAEGLVAGIPLDALTWLGYGLAATAAARRLSA